MTRPGARRYRRTMVVLAVALVITVLIAVAVGAVWIPPSTTIRVLAWKLGLTHSRTGEWMSFEAPLPEDFTNALSSL